MLCLAFCKSSIWGSMTITANKHFQNATNLFPVYYLCYSDKKNQLLCCWCVEYLWQASLPSNKAQDVSSRCSWPDSVLQIFCIQLCFFYCRFFYGNKHILIHLSKTTVKCIAAILRWLVVGRMPTLTINVEYIKSENLKGFLQLKCSFFSLYTSHIFITSMSFHIHIGY